MKIINYLTVVSLMIYMLFPAANVKAEEAYANSNSVLYPPLQASTMTLQTPDGQVGENNDTGIIEDNNTNLDLGEVLGEETGTAEDPDSSINIESSDSNNTAQTPLTDESDSPVTNLETTPEEAVGDPELTTAETNVSQTVMESVYAQTELIDLPPVIHLLGPEIVCVNLGESFAEPGVEAFDDLDGDISSQVIVVSTLDESMIGDYQIKYSVCDSAGNTAEITRIVQVAEPLIMEPEIVEESGRIYDAASESGIAGVEMHFYNSASAEEFITFTDRQGYYSIFLPAGNYQVTLIRNMYNTCVYEVVVGLER